MMNAVVLGAGMVGAEIAADLAADPESSVTVADVSEANLAAAQARAGGRLRTVRADLSDAGAVRGLVEGAEIVLGALASRLGLGALGAVIEAGKNYCDISFMAEDPGEFDAAAKKRGVTAVVDCGVAPGMSHLLGAHAAAELDRCERLSIYVGGLPRERRWPFQYKAAFAPGDVVEEYTRPARLVEGGREVVRDALTDPELLDFAGIGTLEAVNTDGLRSLVRTLPVPNMVEKTLRYPGHYEQMRVLRHMGLFGERPIFVGGREVVPREVAAALLFPLWTYEENEEDLTVMRIVAEGERGGRACRIAWDLLDFYDRETRATSMSRTTAFPCAIVARLIARGRIGQRGVLTPEMLAPMPGVVETILAEHRARGVVYKRTALHAG